MTSVMQYFGKSLNKISKFRRHEKASKMRRRIFGLADEILTDSWSIEDDDDVETEKFRIFNWFWIFKDKVLYLRLAHFDGKKSLPNVDKLSIFSSLIRIKLTLRMEFNCARLRLHLLRLSIFFKFRVQTVKLFSRLVNRVAVALKESENHTIWRMCTTKRENNNSSWFNILDDFLALMLHEIHFCVEVNEML